MIDPNEVHNRILTKYKAWADARHEADKAEFRRKRTFSSLVIRYLEDAKSVAKAEHMARCDEVYEATALAAEDRAHEANVARGDLDAATAWFDALRSAESTMRAEINLK